MQIPSAAVKRQEKRAQLRDEFPADAAWIDAMRQAFPGCKFREWTVDGEPI